MPAYVIAELDITDPAGFAAYREAVPATIAAHGGRYLARAGALETVEGDWRPKRLAVIEFPSMERARQWYESRAYQPLIEIRKRTALTNLVFVEGLP
jgi:uncharacterized protein (DUF1330 family)